MPDMSRILVVEDHVILREGLVSLFKPQPDFQVVGEAGSVAEAVSACRRLKPDLVLMDYTLPDGTGPEATRSILSENPSVGIVFLTIHEDDEQLFAAIQSGACGYLLKNVPVAKMMEALRGLRRGEAPLSREMTGRLVAHMAHLAEPGSKSAGSSALLTRREVDVIRMVAKGSSNQEIAGALFVSINTVKNHIHNMLEKLGMKNRRDLTSYAIQSGLVRKTH